MAYSTSDGTAGSDDYTAAEGEVTFAAGDTTDKTFSVAITDDSLPEDEETFTVNLGTVTSALSTGRHWIPNRPARKSQSPPVISSPSP